MRYASEGKLYTFLALRDVNAMDWISLALLSAVVFGSVSVLDRRLLVRYFPVVSSLSFSVGFVQLGVAAITLAVCVPVLGVPELRSSIIATISGAIWAIGLMSYFKGMQMEEVSRATPIAQGYPIFASILSVIFLEESMNLIQWLLVLVVVLGAGLLSFKPNQVHQRMVSLLAFSILVFGSIMVGTAFVVGKVALGELDLWTMSGFRALGMGTAMVVLNYRKETVHLSRVAFKNYAGLRMFLITEGFLAPIALLLLLASISIGPVSLVSAVASTRPLFVLIIASIFSIGSWNYINEPLDRNTLTLKTASILMMIFGVAGLGLT